MGLLNIFITFHIVTYWHTVSTKFCSMSPICVCYFDDTYANISDRLEAITQVERERETDGQLANKEFALRTTSNWGYCLLLPPKNSISLTTLYMILLVYYINVQYRPIHWLITPEMISFCSWLYDNLLSFSICLSLFLSLKWKVYS